MNNEMVGAISVICIFGWIPLKVILGHLSKMAEIKVKAGTGGENVARQLAEMQNELKALRETTTRFDVSFDAALTRLEERVGSMETERIRTQYDTVSAESPEQAAMRMRH
jgi:hypothetical protein